MIIIFNTHNFFSLIIIYFTLNLFFFKKKMSFLNIIQNFFYQLDLFKFGFAYQFSKGQKNVSTFLGFICSLIIFSILILTFTNSDMIQKTNPSVISQNFPQISSPNILLKNSTFKIKFAIFSKDIKVFLLDPSIFYFGVTGMKLSPDLNGDRVWTYKNFSYHVCSAEEMNEEKSLVVTKFSNALCIDYEDWEIGGSYFDSTFSKFSLKLYICKNDSSNKAPCKSEDEIKSFFQEKYLGIYYKDFYVDVNDYENPLKNFPNIEILQLSLYTDNSNEINMIAGEMIQDDGILMSSEKIFDYYSKYKLTSASLSRDINDTKPIGEFDFVVTSNLIQIKRIYQKLPDVLAKLSGIAQVLMIFVFLIMNLFQKMVIDLYFIQKVLKFKKKKMFYKQTSLEGMFSQKSDFRKEKELNSIQQNKKIENNSISYSPENRKNIEFAYINPKKPEDDSLKSVKNRELTKNNIPKNNKIKNFRILVNQIINPTNINLDEMREYIMTKIKCLFGCNLNERQKIYSQSFKKLDKLLNIKNILRKINFLDF